MILQQRAYKAAIWHTPSVKIEPGGACLKSNNPTTTDGIELKQRIVHELKVVGIAWEQPR